MSDKPNSVREMPQEIQTPPITPVDLDLLIGKMNLREKIGQLNQYAIGEEMTGPGSKSDQSEARYKKLISGEVGSVLNLVGAENVRKVQRQVVEQSRLGIPMVFAYDVIHGYKTIFPIPLAESSSWDLEAIGLSAKIAARESAAAGLNWTFAPMVDVSQDPRWGRVMEGAGEDPYLGTLIAEARIRGFQGDDLSSPYTIAACAKHFAAYGFVQSGKEYNNVYIGNNTLFNMVLPPFKKSVEIGVATMMNAFNDIDGIPATAHEFLLRDLLKGTWGFDGVVVSDWNSIGELITHGTAENKKDAARQAIVSGSDVDMEGDVFIDHLEELVLSGEVKEDLIDDAVKRVLKMKMDLGLFDDPYRYCDSQREQEILLHPQHLEAARDIARKSIVLLKNDDHLLPLKKDQKIALIGPLIKDKDTPVGSWRAQGDNNSAVSLYEGLVSALGSEKDLFYAKGCQLSIGENSFFEKVEIEKNDRSGFAEAIETAKKADVVIMNLGETAFMSGEAKSRADIGLPGLQQELLKEVYKVNKNIVLVLMNGRPLTLTWEDKHLPAILETWHLGSQAGHAIADVLLGKYSPAGRLTMSFPREVGQIPIYYNHKNTGRPESEYLFYAHYADVSNEPLYPFGYGLTYTTFDYGDIVLSRDAIVPTEELEVAIEVTNTGSRAGEEVVQLYIQDMVASITRPVKELRGFKKVFLSEGETKRVVFKVTIDDLSFYNAKLTYGYETGKFKVMVGPNAETVQEAVFELKKG